MLRERDRMLRGRVLDSAGGGPVANALISVDGPEGLKVASGRSDELGKNDLAVSVTAGQAQRVSLSLDGPSAAPNP